MVNPKIWSIKVKLSMSNKHKTITNSPMACIFSQTKGQTKHTYEVYLNNRTRGGIREDRCVFRVVICGVRRGMRTVGGGRWGGQSKCLGGTLRRSIGHTQGVGGVALLRVVHASWRWWRIRILSTWGSRGILAPRVWRRIEVISSSTWIVLVIGCHMWGRRRGRWGRGWMVTVGVILVGWGVRFRASLAGRSFNWEWRWGEPRRRGVRRGRCHWWTFGRLVGAGAIRVGGCVIRFDWHGPTHWLVACKEMQGCHPKQTHRIRTQF